MRVACLGTSANPPHLGHLRLSRQLLKNKLVDEVWVIPCRKHSFDKPLLPWKHRWKMVKLMEEPGIRACDIEKNIPGKNYTIKTVRFLRRRYPTYKFYWIIGTDIVKTEDYKKWKNWPELKKKIKFLVVSRSGYKIKKPKDKCFSLLKNIQGSYISSTLIRRRLKENLPIEHLVPKKIANYLKYLKKHNLIRYE